jgi:hypothetical protein
MRIVIRRRWRVRVLSLGPGAPEREVNIIFEQGESVQARSIPWTLM